MLIEPNDVSPEDPAVHHDENDVLVSIDWPNVRNDSLRELYFGYGALPGICAAAAAEAVRRLAAGLISRDDLADMDLLDAAP